MSSELVDGTPLWALLLATIALLSLAMEGGYRLGKWRHGRLPEETDPPAGAMVGSILGLLALVLGFTFTLAATRFEQRRQAVLEEANDIGTTYLRTRFLPEPERTRAAAFLREYVQLRIGGRGEAHAARAIARSEEVHTLLWNEAVAAAGKSPSITTSLFVQSLNAVIDVHASRVLVGRRSRIPGAIWGGLVTLALIGMGAVGYQSGVSATRRSPAALGLVLAFALVLILIADLDRGQTGLLRVSQQALIDVERSMVPRSPGDVAP